MSFNLPPILLPNATDFAELLEYCGEWSNLRGWTPPVDPRYLMTSPATTSWERQAYRSWPSKGNEIGPYCTVDLSQLGGQRFRSIVVRATDAVIDAVKGRIVTPDDHLGFKIIGHVHDGQALVILQHGYIIGSHWLAHIDPATIPAYPFEARDAAFKQICEAIRSMGDEPYVGDLPDHGRYVHPIPAGQSAFTRQPDRTRRVVIDKDGRTTLEWPDVNEHTGEPWKTITEAPR